ncbi:glycosyltransferase family 9 protein [Thiobacter aerophilum]|uniref:Glycosyltransferase family 9 protein n=1 Tax=Thiobacter aerophilum TaxID=3121275 RepID=A0ABV0EGA3_9BURK
MKILLIRRDNIGDLVCTTPLFSALRARFPEAFLAAFVNSYNAEVLAGNPHLDSVYSYTKAKHRAPGKTAAEVYWDRLKLFWHLRRMRFDYAIIAGAHFLPRALRLARAVSPRHIIGFTEPGKAGVAHIDIAIPYTLPHPLHEVEDIFRLLAPLGIEGPPGPLTVVAPPEETARAQAALATLGQGPVVGLHISARKPSQRWPKERFAELARLLVARHGVRLMLFWSPGSESNPLHPGDDEKAAWIVEATQGLPTLRVKEPFSSARRHAAASWAAGVTGNLMPCPNLLWPTCSRQLTYCSCHPGSRPKAW